MECVKKNAEIKNSNRVYDSSYKMSEEDARFIRRIQDGIEFKENPYAEIAADLNMTEQEVVARISFLIDKKIIRRFGASIGHRAIGFIYNAMIVWNVPDEKVREAGTIMASFKEVSHCYERPRFPDPPYNWPYNMFAMVHGRSAQECESTAKRISNAIGINDYKLIFSVREFKKTGVRI